MFAWAKSFEDLAPFFDQWDDGVQVIDDEMRYRYMNPAVALQGKSTRERLIGCEMFECYPGIEKTELYRHIQRVRDTGKEDSLENTFTFPDGSQGWFELKMYRIPGAVVIVSKDISARRSLELHARHGQRMEAAAKLAGGLAHGFNNALMVISSLAEMGLADEQLNESRRRDFEKVLEATERASALTRKLLALARQFPGGKVELIPIRKFLERLLPALQDAAGSNTTVHLDVADDVGAIRMDPSALEQLFAQLVTNASAAMPKGGAVQIAASRAPEDAALPRPGAPRLSPGHYISLRVKDTGTGIPADVIEKIFDPFFTFGGGTGSGLGLAMCWGLVEQAGGTIRVNSQEGQGTTMEVLLQRHDSLQDVPTVVSPVTGKASRGARLLVVDDEELVLHTVSRLLTNLGYIVCSASGGAEALAVLKKGERFDLALTDVAMPQMTGLELIRKVREAGWLMPVLVMTGYSPDHHALRDIAPERLLTKPFSLKQLRAAVELALGSELAEPQPQLS